jgi:hypothetical protein
MLFENIYWISLNGMNFIPVFSFTETFNANNHNCNSERKEKNKYSIIENH